MAQLSADAPPPYYRLRPAPLLLPIKVNCATRFESIRLAPSRHTSRSAIPPARPCSPTRTQLHRMLHPTARFPPRSGKPLAATHASTSTPAKQRALAIRVRPPHYTSPQRRTRLWAQTRHGLGHRNNKPTSRDHDLAVRVSTRTSRRSLTSRSLHRWRVSHHLPGASALIYTVPFAVPHLTRLLTTTDLLPVVPVTAVCLVYWRHCSQAPRPTHRPRRPGTSCRHSAAAATPNCPPYTQAVRLCLGELTAGGARHADPARAHGRDRTAPHSDYTWLGTACIRSPTTRGVRSPSRFGSTPPTTDRAAASTAPNTSVLFHRRTPNPLALRGDAPTGRIDHLRLDDSHGLARRSLRRRDPPAPSTCRLLDRMNSIAAATPPAHRSPPYQTRRLTHRSPSGIQRALLQLARIHANATCERRAS